MIKQNVTLAIPKDLLRKAKIIAVEQETSLSQLLTQALTDIVTQADLYELAKERHLAWLQQGVSLGTDGEISWTREELHER